MSYMDALLTAPVLAKNLTATPCSWCSDGCKAAHAIMQGSWTDFACVKHTEKYWPGLRPADRRPAEDATVFKMRMLVVGGDIITDGGWETYASFNELFRESRALTASDAFIETHSGSNSHYRTTGHHRVVLRPKGHPERSSRMHVVIHIVMK